MIVRIPVTKIYDVEVGEEDPQSAQDAEEARRAARSMSVDQIERAGYLVTARAGNLEWIRSETPFTD